MATEPTAADVFGLLANDIRLEVLETIALAQHEEPYAGVAAPSFSEIYDRVDVGDTAKLSYHLGELEGTFLRKHDDGYAFTHAGEQLVRFVLSENYRSPPDFGSVETEGRCLHCGETALLATLHEQFFVVRCSDCDQLAFSYRVRPAQVRPRDGTELVEAVVWEQAGDFVKLRQGVCPECAGRVETEVLESADEAALEQAPISIVSLSECHQCRRFFSMPLTHAAAYHPESVAFHWDHGVDVMGTGFWELHEYLHDGRWSAERAVSDPEDYLVELQWEASTLRLFLDDAAEVTRTERVRQREGDGRRTTR